MDDLGGGQGSPPPTLPLYGRVGGTDHLITTPAKRKEVTCKIMSKIGGYQILEVLTSGGPIQDPRYTREVYSLPLMEPAGSFAPKSTIRFLVKSMLWVNVT